MFEIDASTASADFQLNCVDCPQFTWFAWAESWAVTGATGTIALATPASNRGCGPSLRPRLKSFVFVAPL